MTSTNHTICRAHTTFPVLGMPIAEFAKDKIGKVRDFVVITDEEIANGRQSRGS
ncbi:MAG: hypothetical protein JO358_02305 [Alphaproteobacteria bacterium]|nr:hypothetical protein [Alphaproteobacteria bacterium]